MLLHEPLKDAFITRILDFKGVIWLATDNGGMRPEISNQDVAS